MGLDQHQARSHSPCSPNVLRLSRGPHPSTAHQPLWTSGYTELYSPLHAHLSRDSRVTMSATSQSVVSCVSRQENGTSQSPSVNGTPEQTDTPWKEGVTEGSSQGAWGLRLPAVGAKDAHS